MKLLSSLVVLYLCCLVCKCNGSSDKLCCEDAGKKWWWSPRTSKVCASARWADQACARSITFSEAAELCNRVGARLCTLEEVTAKHGRRLKCGLKKRHVWTSTTCSDGGQAGKYSALGNSGKKIACEVENGAVAGLMCCADSCGGEGGNEQADPALQPVFEEMNRLMMKEEGESYLPQDYVIHDPSRVVAAGDDHLMIAVTGKERAFGYSCGVETWYMKRGENKWKPAQCIMQKAPKWLSKHVGRQNKGTFWAPALIDDKTMLYSATNFKERANTCIGLMTASGDAPNQLKWIDHGEPLTCTKRVREEGAVPQPSSIDPASFVDPQTGIRYLIYGGGHIYIAPLDGLIAASISKNKKQAWWKKNSEIHTLLANGPTIEEEGDEEQVWIEAPFMTYHEGQYYLFLNWHGCCNGADSTYEIRVGRASSPLGPFLDKKGINLASGGGSMFLSGENTKKYDFCAGPGHAGVMQVGNGYHLFTYHCYDMRSKPWSFIYSRSMEFAHGWPELQNKPFNFVDYWS